MSITQTIAHYDEHASELSRSYNALETSAIFPGFVERLPRAKEGSLRALDMGCGPGRDAFWLAERGFQVIAFDGSAGMIAQAQKLNSHGQISYLVDRMPEMAAVTSLGMKFDVMLMSAVWMHLDPGHRKDTFMRMMGLSNPGCLIHISLRHGPDSRGRIMYEVGREELEALARENRIGFSFAGRFDDPLGRMDVCWDHVILKV